MSGPRALSPWTRALRSVAPFALVLAMALDAAAGAGVVPVGLTATVDDKEVAVTGRFLLKLEFTPKEDVAEPLSVVLMLGAGGRNLLTLRHAPPTPTREWKKGVKVAYEVEVPFPFDANLADRDSVELWFGFVDAETGDARPPDVASGSMHGLVEIAQLPIPRSTQDADAALAAADALVKAGRKDAAWDALDLGLRRAPDDPTKYRFRDAMVKVGALAPRPLSLEEQQVVTQRIDEERNRVLREAAGRFLDQKRFHAALRILETIGGKLAEQGNQAVMGAVNAAKRAEQDAQDIREKLVEQFTPEEQGEAEAAIKTAGLTRELMKRVDEWVKARKFAVARYALNKLYRGDDGEAGKDAYARLKTVEKEWCAATPADQQALVDAAVNHPSFARTAWVASREFIYIGPKTLVEGIPAQSKMRFDLAYVFQTDLFGRRPNPGGDRVTVYFKELFDFGGGIGGGKTIDIGKADPNAKETRVDNGLLYHELTHCVDDTEPIHPGFREGLANFGAAYTFEALGQSGDVLHAFESNLDAFKKDYLARDLEYWRIQNYGPSAGFFLHFVDKYAKTKGGHDWSGWRRFFREYRTAPVRDGREPFLIRPFARSLVAAFGPGAFDDLIAFRFPLVAADRDAIVTEVESFDAGLPSVSLAAENLKGHPNSPFPRDAATRYMLEKAMGNDEEGARADAQSELGIVFDWRCIGPFEERGADAGTFPFPPEYEIDFARDYPGKGNICKWTEAGATGAVKIDATGWVTFDYSYQDDTACYALTHASVAEDTDAWAWLRADDDVVLFVNGDLAGSYDSRWIEATQLGWRGPLAKVPDAMRLPVSLKKGRNRVLVKVRNRGGPSGFVLALSRKDGRPIDGLATDRDPPSPPVMRRPPAPEEHWKRAARLEFSKSAKLAATVGRFEIANKALAGTSKDKGVAWRKYTVRPGFPKDSPSNLAWLPAKTTEGVNAFRLTLQTVTAKDQAPKLALTFQGEGETDGLSGWTLILRPAGDGRAQASLERYDREVYSSAPVDFAWADTVAVVLTYEARRVTVRLANAALLTDVPIDPIPGKDRIGFSTWGPEVKFASIDLEVPKR